MRSRSGKIAALTDRGFTGSQLATECPLSASIWPAIAAGKMGKPATGDRVFGTARDGNSHGDETHKYRRNEHGSITPSPNSATPKVLSAVTLDGTTPLSKIIMTTAQPDKDAIIHSRRRISRDLEHLLYDIEKGTQRADYDVIVVGSGYGGAIAAERLGCHGSEGTSLSVLVLERGKEYLPGNFPAALSEAPSHIRFNTTQSNHPHGVEDGLFDFRIGADCNVLVANGIGGGSLINAGVMDTPASQCFDERWPEKLRGGDALQKYYAEARQRLGAELADQKTNGVKSHASGVPQKFQAMQALGKANTREAPITVAMQDKETISGTRLAACNYCGDCATGCNVGAKESLDTNLLDRAQQQGVDIVAGATVQKLSKVSGADAEQTRWQVHLNYTEKNLRRRHGNAVILTAQRVILAAGALGSTEIIKRSESDELHFSTALGKGFSGNGDMIASIYRHNQTVNAVAREEIPAGERRVGPTITSIVDACHEGQHFLVEDLAVPGSLSLVFEELTSIAHQFHELNRLDCSHHTRLEIGGDPCAVDEEAIANSSVVAMFGDDGGDGQLQLYAAKDDANSNGCLTVHWPNLREHPLFEAQIACLTRLTEESGIDGQVIPNPMWKFLPDNIDFLDESSMRGPLLTVHPLGGCAMADNCANGVVDDCGRVYDGDPTLSKQQVHDGLFVLDGAIIPSSLGTNPALCIAAVAMRAMDILLQEWQLSPLAQSPRAQSNPLCTAADIPITKQPAPDRLDRTSVELVERLGGEITVDQRHYHIDITARYRAEGLLKMARGLDRTLQIDQQQSGEEQDSQLRIIEKNRWIKLSAQYLESPLLEKKLDEAAVFLAPLGGELSIFQRQPSSATGRICRGLWAWFRNRGLRDAYQGVARCFSGNKRGRFSISRLWHRARNLFALASRAGEKRSLEYSFVIGANRANAGHLSDFAARLENSSTVSGIKRFGYVRRGNPWRQLMELELSGLPFTAQSKPILRLDTEFLARQKVPLFRIVKQENQVSALADSLSFLGYFTRLLISSHLWSFRQPDAINPDPPERLPGSIPGIPDAPEITTIEMDNRFDDGDKVELRLTRYRREDASAHPVVMLHGYSASGTSFAHPTVRPNLAEFFWQQGHEVWVVDLRTSSGHEKTAVKAWTFEDVAFNDIPAALSHIHRETGSELNVIAHCMGAAMFSMAMLAEPEKGKPYFEERKQLPAMIHRVAFSQVGPRVHFSADNVLRAYLMRFALNALPMENYQFRPEKEPGLAGKLLDRLLSTLPYPEEEFDIENPFPQFWRKARFTTTRHRMDALYGRDFSIKNIDLASLDKIDDFFGPLCIDTLSQTIHFNRWNTITNREGENHYVSRLRFKNRWPFPTLSVHGAENGLSDPCTLRLMGEAMDEAGCHYESFSMPEYGHQDCLIGTGAIRVFERIHDFFNPVGAAVTKRETGKPRAEPPWIGPHLRLPLDGRLPVRLAPHPRFTPPKLAVFIAVHEDKDCYRRCADIDYAISILPEVDGLADFSLSPSLFIDASEGVLCLLIYAFDALLNDERINTKVFCDPKLGNTNLLCERDLNSLDDDTRRLLTPLLNRIECERPNIESAIDEALSHPKYALQSAFIPTPKGFSEHKPPATKVTFAVGSCQFPAGLFDAVPACASFSRLQKVLQSDENRPELALFLGDQVYIDATAGLFDPVSLSDRFRRPYERLYRHKPVAEVLRQLPSATMMDDHEIVDNWEPVAGSDSEGKQDDKKKTFDLSEHRRLGVKAFLDWQRPGLTHKSEEQLWFEFEHRQIPFFIADTRSNRSHRSIANFDSAELISGPQMQAFRSWLNRNTEKAQKFIASPALPLPRLKSIAAQHNSVAALRCDGWNGYPKSLRDLLGYIAANNINGVCFLSGDAHLSFNSDITLEFHQQGSAKSNKPVLLRSVHCSGMYSPYPFANASVNDFQWNEEFSLELTGVTLGEGGDDSKTVNGTLKVKVRTSTENIVVGNGFTLIKVSADDQVPTIILPERELFEHTRTEQ